MYSLIKAYARLALRLYCRRITLEGAEWLQAPGPILFAANHPNSFMDGMILTTLYEGKLYSLARGDAFKKPRWDRLLRRLRLLPVYRTSEGTENLNENYTTFSSCRAAFAEGSAVLIFSEGGCKNEWHLRPLRKGTARLALSAWSAGLPLRVVPVGFNYSPFRLYGKNVWIGFGRPLDSRVIMQQETDGQQIRLFNEQLRAGLQELVWEIPAHDRKAVKARLTVPLPYWKRVLLFLPAAAGALLHAPLYFGVKAVTGHYFDNDHFDSVLVSLLLLLYPIYLLVAAVIGAAALGWTGPLLLPLLPLTAWACVQLKPQA